MTEDMNIKKRIVLIAATLGTFVTPFMSSSINVALPAIGEQFSASAVLLGWVATSYILTTAIFLVPLGKIADIYGRKKIFSYGVLVFSFSSLFCVISKSIALLLCFRVLQGVGSAMIFSTSIAILTSVFPPGERGRALGINIATIYLGLSLGPVLGGILTQHFGWKSIFMIILPLALPSVFLIHWKVKEEWAESQGERFDLTGSLIYCVSLLSLMYGLSVIPAIRGLWLILAGISGIALFIWWELKVENPVVNMNLFKNNKVFTFSNLAALINYSATFAIGFLLSLYLQYIKGFNPQEAGLILVAQPLVMALLSPLAGRLSDKVESRILASSGMAVLVLGLIPLVILNAYTAPAFIVFDLMVLGFGFALFSSPNTNAIMSSVEKNYYGIASATLATMRMTGQLFSMGIVMLIFALNGMGSTQITPQTHGLFLNSNKTIFIIFTVLCIGGIFASLARGKAGEKINGPLQHQQKH